MNKTLEELYLNLELATTWSNYCRKHLAYLLFKSGAELKEAKDAKS